MSFELLKSFVTLEVRGFRDSMRKLREFEKLGEKIKGTKIDFGAAFRGGGRGGGRGASAARADMDAIKRSLGGFSTSVQDSKRRFRELRNEVAADSAEIGKNITTMVRSSRSEITRLNVFLRTGFRSAVEANERARSQLQKRIRLALFRGNISDARRFVQQLRAVENRARRLNGTIRNLSRALTVLRTAVKLTVAAFTGLAGIALGGLGGLSSAIRGATNLMGSFLLPTQAVLETMRRITQLGPLLVSGLAIGAARGAFNTFREFEDNLTRARADFEILGRSGAGAYALIEDAALSAAKTTPFSAAEAAEAINAFAKSSFSVIETLRALPRSLEFATVAKILDPAEAARISTGVLRQFNRPVKDLDDVNDAFVLAGTRSQKSVAEIARAFEGLGSIGQEIDLPFEEALAIITRITSKNVGASESATALRIALTETLRESDKVDAALQPLGRSIRDFTNASVTRFRQGGFLDFLEVIASNESAWKRFREIVGARGFRFGSATDRGSILQVRRLLDEIYQAQGTNVTQRRFAAIINTVEQRYKQLRDIVKDVGIRIASTLVEDIRGSILDIQKLFKQLSGFADSALGKTFIKRTAAGIKSLVVLFRPFVAAFSRVSAIVNTLTFSALTSFLENTLPSLTSALDNLANRFEQLSGTSFRGFEDAIKSIQLLFGARGEVGQAIIDSIFVIAKALPPIMVDAADIFGQEILKHATRFVIRLGNDLARRNPFLPQNLFNPRQFEGVTRRLERVNPGMRIGRAIAEALFEDENNAGRRLSRSVRENLDPEDLAEKWAPVRDKVAGLKDEVNSLISAEQELIDQRAALKVEAFWSQAIRGIEDRFDAIRNRAKNRLGVGELEDALGGGDFRARILGLPQLQALLATADDTAQVAVKDNTNATRDNTHAIEELSIKMRQNQARLEPLLLLADQIAGGSAVKVSLS